MVRIENDEPVREEQSLAFRQIWRDVAFVDGGDLCVRQCEKNHVTSANGSGIDHFSPPRRAIARDLLVGRSPTITRRPLSFRLNA